MIWKEGTHINLHTLDDAKMAAHTESGSARGFFQLMREFFLSTVAKVFVHSVNCSL